MKHEVVVMLRVATKATHSITCLQENCNVLPSHTPCKFYSDATYVAMNLACILSSNPTQTSLLPNSTFDNNIFLV